MLFPGLSSFTSRQLVLWKGDAEFPPEGTIMFDRTITDYLP
ncbi:MAG: DUF3786 domain-containing protein, partial [Dehalococcoidia bacterium]|nr:DUF3786 domain-containing protein [Dehalococcoidia bacterium]